MKYDASKKVDPSEWLDLDEQERISLVLRHHEDCGDTRDLQSPMGHAVFHVIVENQVAGGPATPVAAVLDRLIGEGLERHDAIHAIGSILAEHMAELRAGTCEDADANEAYYGRLAALTAKGGRGAG